MLKKPWRIIKSDTCSSECKIYGNNHWIEITYEVPPWEEEKAEPEVHESFMYKGVRYFLGDFMPVTKDSPFFIPDKDVNQLFDSYQSDSFFSGILIKYDFNEAGLRAYTYIS